jgi:hypothetical protein
MAKKHKVSHLGKKGHGKKHKAGGKKHGGKKHTMVKA